MKFKENYIRAIVKEELKRLTEDINNEEENKIAHLSYILLSKAREKFEDYLGDLPEGEEPSDEFQKLFDAISEAWGSADKVLTGGETRDALPGLFEDNGDCTQEEISHALDVVSRCVMKGKSERPSSRETELGVMPKRVSAPPAGVKSGGVKWIDEDKENE
tara:strand:+ start:361 stop:843 length:483 start_codon:yes stop_codon:yes gene_type:complete